MSAIISNLFRVRSAESMRDYLASDANNIYMYIAKSTPWDSLGDQATDPDNTWEYLTNSHTDMIVAKRVLSTNITMCINRYDWEPGVVYSQYDTRFPNMHDNNKFYVLTDEMNVYKCLNNNFGGISIAKPIGTSVDPIQLSDGYSWKYMYTLTANDIAHFLNSQFIPVTNEPLSGSPAWVNMSSAVDGSIDSYIVTDMGTGYTTARAKVIGDGTGATIVPVISNGRITRLAVSNRGKDYTWARVEIAGNGTGAAARAQISPRGGHGSNPVEELGGYYIMVNMNFDDIDLDYIPPLYSFRKIGLIENPKDTTGQTFNGYVAGGTHILYVQSNGFKMGDVIEFSNGETSSVLDVSTDGERMIVSGASTISPGDTFFSINDPSITGHIFSITKPNINPTSWNPLFIEHRNMVSTGLSQSQYARFVVEF